MNRSALNIETREIVVDEVFPHAAKIIWNALTDGELIARWMMRPTGFAAVAGTQFTFTTTPAGAWDGLIRCEVLEAEPHRRLTYAWRGGDQANDGAYGSRLDTIVTWTLSEVAGGTRLRIVHSGFVLPANSVAFNNMSQGWGKVTQNLETVVAEQDLLHATPAPQH